MNSKICRPLSVFFAVVLIATSLGAQSRNPEVPYSGLEKIGNREVNGTVNFTSMESEARIGRQAAAEFERKITLADDEDVSSYVERIAQKITKNSDAKFPVTIKVIQSDVVNATALPGGFVYINSATIKAVDSEAELAFVIAHLIGHVAARHATENISRDTLKQVEQKPAIILSETVHRDSIRELSERSVETTKREFSRAAIKEADFLGLEYLYQSGYDPQAAVRFLRMLEESEVSRPKQSAMFKTHPPTAERITLMEKHIKLVLPPRENNILNTPEFDAIRLRVN
jgi:predicted Zn-dependent protease